MTILQKEIEKRSKAISIMGNLMAQGQIDITPKSESLLQTSLTALLEVNEQDRKLQGET
jgi:hypothetical protein